MAAGAARQGSGGQDHGGEVIAFEPLPLIQSERRLSLRAYHHWRARAGEAALPRLVDCPDIASAPFAGHMVLLDLPDDGKAGGIRSIGATFARELGTDGAGAGERLMTELVRRLPALALQRAPIGFEAELPATASGLGSVSVRGILLPFADADGRLAHVMGVMSWRHAAEGAPGIDVLGALATVSDDAAAVPSSVWDRDADLPGTGHDRGDLLAAAATWAALARSGAARARTHLHRAIGLIHDAAAGLPQDELGVTIEVMLGDLVGQEEREMLVGALSQARGIGLGGRKLADLLDRAGLAEFLAGPARMEAALAERPMPAAGFRLSPLDPSFLAPARIAEVPSAPAVPMRRQAG